MIKRCIINLHIHFVMTTVLLHVTSNVNQVHQSHRLQLQPVYEQLHRIIYIIHRQVFKINIELVQHDQNRIHDISMITLGITCKHKNDSQKYHT